MRRRITPAAVKRRLSRGRAVAVSQVRAAQYQWQRRGPRLPVDFEDWLERRSGRKTAEFPDAWRSDDRLVVAEPSTVGVLLHVFYPELVPEIISQLNEIPVRFDLIVTNASGEQISVDRADVPRARHIRVLDVENHGRDIWPMVQVVNAGLLDPYELVLKVHTKRSEWRSAHQDLAGTGEGWRGTLLATLLGDRQNIATVMSRVRGEPEPGRRHRRREPARSGVLGRRPRREQGAAPPGRVGRRSGRAALPVRIVLLGQGIRPAGLTRSGLDLRGLRPRGRSDRRHDGARDRTGDRHPRRGGRSVLVRAIVRLRRPARQLATLRARPTPAASNPGHTVLPPAVPPDTRERRVVGKRLHRVDKRRPPRVRCIEVTTSRTCPPISGSTTSVSTRCGRPRWTSPRRSRRRRLHVLLLLVRRSSGCCPARSSRSWPVPSTSRSASCGPMRIGPVAGTAERRTSSWGRTTTECRQRCSSTTYCRSCATRATCASAGCRVLAVYRVGQIPTSSQSWTTGESGPGPQVSANCLSQRRRGPRVRRLGRPGQAGRTRRDPRVPAAQPEVGVDVPRRSGRQPAVQGKHPELPVDGRGRGAEDGRARPSMNFPASWSTFDNTARRQWTSDVWYGANPYTFRRWLSTAASAVAHREPGSGSSSSTRGTSGPSPRSWSRRTGSDVPSCSPSAISCTADTRTHGEPQPHHRRPGPRPNRPDRAVPARDRRSDEGQRAVTRHRRLW